MPKLSDLLASENADTTQAAQAALHGRSQTGFSGRHTEIDPVAARRVERPTATAEAGKPPLPPRPNAAALERERIPFGDEELQLAWPAREGYRNYWFNDVPGRIARARRAGYSHVIDPDTGDSACLITDKTDGRGRKSYLMEIPMQWYQEDMARSAESLERRLHDIRHGRAGPGADDNRYIPSQGISIKGR